MSAVRSPGRPATTEAAIKANYGVRIFLERAKSHIQSDSPTSPTLTPHDFKELWEDVRTKADTTQEPAEESTQDLSKPEGNATEDNAKECRKRKRRVRTREQDSSFTATNLKDFYAIVQEDSELTEADFENLDRYLPSKIVNNTRDQAQDCVRRGDTEGACKVLEVALDELIEQSKQQKHITLTPWRISVADILIDQGRRQDARSVLPRVSASSSKERTSADSEYQKMMEMMQLEESVERYYRAEDYDQAREAAQKLHGIHPSYFDLDKPMDRFNHARRFLIAGSLAELEARKATDPEVRTSQLTQALEIYNRGCHALEIYYEFFDSNESTVSGFDHSHCANIFFSAARICHNFDVIGHCVSPRSFGRKARTLTCLDWKHQALHFLEKGRARALLDSINRGSVVDGIRRRLIKKTIIFVAEAAQSLLRKRNSAISSARSSRAPSTSVGIPVTQMRTLTESDFSSRNHDRHLLRSLAHQEPSTMRQDDNQALTIQTNLTKSAISALPPSPAGAVTPVLGDEDYSQLKIRMRWRRCLLGALTHPTLRPSLRTAVPSKEVALQTCEDIRAKIPSDTLVVEFALASQPPFGIMVVVATADAVEKITWREANVEKIRKCIGLLRASMQTSNARTDSNRQPVPPIKLPTRPNPLERKDSIGNQLLLDELLRDLVVAPVEPHMKGKKKMIIIPSGDLAHVPWRIFFDLPVTVVPSLEIWVQLQAQVNTETDQQPKLSVVTTAPEDMEKKMKHERYLRDIPFSRLEALYIARLHEQAPFLADDKCYKDLEVLAKDTHVLHICAHSNFDPNSPMSSSLELFKKPLTIRDWHKLSIKADLVVFSSCVSGYSKAYDSGSTIGFAHTLLGTGTKAFIGSLWKVDDRATLLLMTMFYEELRKPLPAVDALYGAQKRMRNLTNDEFRAVIHRMWSIAKNGGTRPYIVNALQLIRDLKATDASEWQQARYWAGFVLTGYGSNNIYPATDQKSS